jgi:hypothetical protein
MADSVEHHVPDSAGTAATKLRAPANAADCHIRIFDPRFEPDDAVLFDLPSVWAPDATIRNCSLVGSPAALYGF